MPRKIPATCGRDQVATTGELNRAGFTNSSIRHRDGRDLRRTLPGVYLLHPGHPTWRQRFRAALKYAGPDAQLTSLAALSLHRFTDVPSPDRVQHVDVLIPSHRRRTAVSYARVHRTNSLPQTPVIHEGFRCAPLPRALADAYAYATATRTLTASEHEDGHAPPSAAPIANSPPNRVPPAFLYEVNQRGLYQACDIRAAFAARQVRLPEELADVLADLEAGAHSVAEGKALRLIEASDLPRPLWNPSLHLDGDFLCRPDAYWPAHGVILEINSVRHHQRARDFHRTMSRQSRLSALGFCVLPVTPAQLRDTPTTVLAQLSQALAGAPYGPLDRVTVRGGGRRHEP